MKQLEFDLGIPPIFSKREIKKEAYQDCLRKQHILFPPPAWVLELESTRKQRAKDKAERVKAFHQK